MDAPKGTGPALGAQAALPPPRAIIFDWDNTLVDTWPNIVHTMNVTLVAMGQAPWTAAEAKQRIARSLRESFPELFGDRWEQARDVFYAELERAHLDMLAPLPGSAETLAHFAAQGVPMAVVSNKTSVYLHREVAHLGWGKYFGAVFGAGDMPHDKPAPDAVFRFLERAGLAPGNDIWFVGDSPVDVEAAHAAGCAPVFVRGAETELPSFAMPPLAVIGDCRALSSIRCIDIQGYNH